MTSAPTPIAAPTCTPYAATGRTAPCDPAEAAVPPVGARYTVRPGDNLSVIARRNDITWQRLYTANRDRVGRNPHLIHPGLRLTIPLA